MDKEPKSLVADLKSLIPGYGSYKAEESRREDDRLTRNFLIKRIDECKSRLDVLGGNAARAGDLDTPLRTEKMRNELDRSRSRLAGAVEGYAGWFSKRTVDEKLLEQVANQDANLVSVADLLATQLAADAIDFNQVQATIELLHQRIDRRGELLKQA